MNTTRNRKSSGLFYTKGEERINTLSHAAGILMGIIVGTLFLIKSDGEFWATFGICLYLFGMLGSYISSTLYHALRYHNPWKKRLRNWDHAAIYWHIAGSYSPITLIALRSEGAWGWGLFGFVWLCAIIGTIVSFREMEEHSNVETICFIVMGLSVLVAYMQNVLTLANIQLHLMTRVTGRFVKKSIYLSITKIKHIERRASIT